jgi:lactam utilization protein B
LPFKGHSSVTLCCHSDSPNAVQIVSTARQIVDDFNKKHGY